VREKLLEHKDKTMRGSMAGSIEWLIMKYADEDIRRATGEKENV